AFPSRNLALSYLPMAAVREGCHHLEDYPPNGRRLHSARSVALHTPHPPRNATRVRATLAEIASKSLANKTISVATCRATLRTGRAMLGRGRAMHGGVQR